jgi:AraC-like DNA-binding protein
LLISISVLLLVVKALLLLFGTTNSKSNYFFVVFLFSINLYYLSHLFWVVFQDIPLSLIFVNHFTPVYFLTGPVLYFYVKSILEGGYRFKKEHLLHLIPFLIQLIAISGYVFTPVQQKAELLKVLLEDPQNALNIQFNLFFSPAGNFAFRLLSVFVYIGLSAYTLNANRHQFKSYRRTFLWLGSLLLSFVSLLLSYTVLITEIFSYPTSLFYMVTGNLSILSLISIGLISFLPLLFPHIIYGKALVKEMDTKDKKQNRKRLEALPNKKMLDLYNKIDVFFKDKEPYLERSFTLPQLAKEMGAPVHHVQKAFKEVGKTTFVEYKTKFKIRWSKKALFDPLFKNDTIDSVGMCAGFNSKSQFYAAFRRFEKMTPREYYLKAKRRRR